MRPASDRMISRLRAAFRLAMMCAMLVTISPALAQNSMIGDGFGGRLWYRPTNYTVGSYSAFSLCYSNPCDSSTNQLYGWGSDFHGELGNGPDVNCSPTPVAIPGMSDVRYFSTGYWMGAIKNDGTGWVWNYNTFPYPTQVITNARFVDASGEGVSFVKNDGTVWSIGSNQAGQFGDGTTISNFSSPVQMTGVTNAVRVAVGLVATYVLLSDSSVLSVGSNTWGSLGVPSILDPITALPVPIPSLSGIVDIKATAYSTTALDAHGDVYSWGHGGYTGDGDWLHDTIPVQLPGLTNVVAISGCTDGDHFLVLDADRNCYDFGNYNLVAWDLAPALIATDVIDIMAGETFSYVVKADGTLWASGWSNCGSVFLDQPDHGQLDPQVELTQLDPSLVPGSCALLGTVAIPTATCSSGTITVYHFGGQEPYQYDIGNGPQVGNIFTNVPLGNYTVTVTDANGCIITLPCAVDATDAPPIVENLGTVNACSDEGYMLPSGTVVYLPGNYADTTSSAFGCDTIRLFNLVLDPFPTASLQDTLCAGEQYVLPSGVVVSAPGVYSDTLVLAGACDTAYTITLIGSLLPPVVASIWAQDTVVAPGGSVVLSGSGGLLYDWSPTSTLSCSTCPNPAATPTETTTYCVVVSNNNSCANDTACIRVTVLSSSVICTTERIYIPTAFSPNGSGQNEMQCVYGADCIANMLLQVFDRWGNKVFESTDPKACWDGTYKGQALDPAVFVYHLSVTMSNGGIVERQGNITLVR